MPSPARSLGAPLTPRRHQPRRTRSSSTFGSPARSTTSGRLTSIIDQFKENNKDSFALSPLGRTVLNDDTDIEQPRRASWWKKVNNSRDVSEVLNNDVGVPANNVIDEIDIEVLSQEKKDYTMDLPESSGSESISSIVVPQRKLFTQKEHQPQKKFGQVIVNRQSMAKHNTTNLGDKIPDVGPKNLFGHGAKRSKPAFPAALLNISPDKTLANKTKELNTEKGQARNLFGNRPVTKRKNMFTDFIVSESEDDISEIQPKLFAFQKNTHPVRHSNPHGIRDPSPTSSITTDIEMDEWNHLPSSTMVDHQLEAMVAITPGKRPKLTEIAESETGMRTNSTINKPSDTSVSANSKSKSHQNYEVEIQVISHDNTVENKIVAKNQNTTHSKSKFKDTSLKINDQQQPNEIVANKSIPLEKGVDYEIFPATLANISTVQDQQDEDDENITLTYDDNAENEENEELHTTLKDQAKNESSKRILTVPETQHCERVDEDKISIELSNSRKNFEIDPSKMNKVVGETPEVTQENNDIDIDEPRDISEPVETSANEADEVEYNDKDKNQEEEMEASLQKEVEVEDEQIEMEEEAAGKDHDKVENQIEVDVQEKDAYEEEDVEPSDQEGVNQEESEADVEDQGEIDDDEQEDVVAVEQEEIDAVEQEETVADVQEEMIADEQEEIDADEQNETDVGEEENDAAVESDGDEEGDEDDQQLNNGTVENKSEDDEEQVSDEEINASHEQVQDESLEQEDEIANDSREQDEDSMENEIQEDEDIENDSQEGHDQSQEDDENEIQNENDEEQVSEDEIANESQEAQDESQEIEDNEEVDQEQEIETNEQLHTDDTNEDPNESHDTTGRNRKKEETKSPEVILHEMTNQNNSFTTQGRNTSIRKTKNLFKNNTIRPSIAPPRESTGFSDGTKNSSAEGSGWDSHRTTRKTLRQTFGRDFTPRKSLRALVMEKSAKRQTAIHEANMKLHQANSTELPSVDPHDDMEYEDIDAADSRVDVSDHEASKRTRQATLEAYMQRIKNENMERNLKIREQIRSSFKSNFIGVDLNRIPTKPVKRPMFKPVQVAPKKKVKSSVIPLENLPPELANDMKYKPPKRFKPSNAPWITNRLYKFLESKLEPKYDYKARVRAEKLVETIYNFARDARRQRVAAPLAVAELKREMARLNIVTTHFDFYNFFHDYMPKEVKVKVVPDIVNEIPMPREGVFSDILVPAE